MATPCTAPFMAGAVAGALAAPPAATLSVFVAMGSALPPPTWSWRTCPGSRAAASAGAWMEWLRNILAFPMYATAAWLVWVLSQEAGPAGLLAGLAGLVLVGAAAWLIGAVQGGRGVARRVGAGWPCAALLGAVALLPRIQGAAPRDRAGRRRRGILRDPAGRAAR